MSSDYAPKSNRPFGWYEKVHWIYDLLVNSCEAPWTVYMKTTPHAAGRMVLTLIETDFTDIIRAYARPGSLRSWSRFDRDKPKSRWQMPIKDTSEVIGEKIPGRKILKVRKVSNGVETLWIIDGVIQRWLWWWLVFDAVTDFVFQWSSAINTEYCIPDASSGEALKTGDSMFWGLQRNWYPLQANTCEKETGDCICSGPGSISFLSGPAQIHVGAVIVPGPDTISIELGVYNGNTGLVEVLDGGFGVNDPGYAQEFVGTHKIHNGGTFTGCFRVYWGSQIIVHSINIFNMQVHGNIANPNAHGAPIGQSRDTVSKAKVGDIDITWEPGT